jgi:hypothetical protein
VTDEPPKDPPGPDAPGPTTAANLDTQPTAMDRPAGQPSVDVSPRAVEPVPAASAGSAPAEDPVLPAAHDENALRDGVGAPRPKPRRKRPAPADNGDGTKPTSRRTIAIAALAIIGGLGVAALVFLGRANAQRYAITCASDRVSAEQGRAFPPWGTRPLVGPEWKPIALPPNAECKPRETDERAALERWYLDLLVDRASTTLTARDLLDPLPTEKPNPLDVAAAQLEQALLLARAPERRDQRKEIERLLGDVQYWRASLRLRDASAALADAARQFDAAAASGLVT